MKSSDAPRLKHEKDLKPASMRVRDAAEALMSCVLSQVNNLIIYKTFNQPNTDISYLLEYFCLFRNHYLFIGSLQLILVVAKFKFSSKLTE